MKHNDTSQKISVLIEKLQEMLEQDFTESAKDHIEDAICELQQAIDELDKDEGTTH
jgi:hypothetical protein